MSNQRSGWRDAPARRGLAVFLLAMSGLLLGVSWRSWAQEPSGWSEPVNLSESDTASLFPAIAVDSAGHVYVVWGEFTSDHDGRPDSLMFRMWDGQTWSPANDAAFGGHLPQIGVDSRGRLHLLSDITTYRHAWAQEDPSNAKAWTPARELRFRDSYWPHMVIDSQDRIHVVFQDTMRYDEQRMADRELLCAAGCSGIYYTRSIDGGDSWSDPIQLDTSEVDASTPCLAVDRLGNVYAVWADTDVYEGAVDISFSYSTDGGETWSMPRRVVTGARGYAWPQIAVDSTGTIHVAWHSGNVGLDYMMSSDGGESWSQVEILHVVSDDNTYSFGLDVDSADNLHLVIPLVGIETPLGVYHLVRPAGGQWSPPSRISQNPCSAASADVELVISQGNRLHAVWYDRQECVLGHTSPFGRGEVFYSTLMADAPAMPPRPLPPMLTVTPAPTPVHIAEVTVPATPDATPSPAVTISVDAEPPVSAPVNPVVVGTVLSVVLIVGVVVWKAISLRR